LWAISTPYGRVVVPCGIQLQTTSHRSALAQDRGRSSCALFYLAASWNPSTKCQGKLCTKYTRTPSLGHLGLAGAVVTVSRYGYTTATNHGYLVRVQPWWHRCGVRRTIVCRYGSEVLVKLEES